jgi:hypothetical protein
MPLRRGLVLLAAILVVVGTVAGCGDDEGTNVPSVVGEPVDAAVNTLSEAGFPVSVSRTPSRETPGSVVSQSPEGDTDAAEHGRSRGHNRESRRLHR